MGVGRFVLGRARVLLREAKVGVPQKRRGLWGEIWVVAVACLAVIPVAMTAELLKGLAMIVLVIPAC